MRKSMEMAKRALSHFLQSLPPGNYFDIIYYSPSYEDLKQDNEPKFKYKH